MPSEGKAEAVEYVHAKSYIFNHRFAFEVIVEKMIRWLGKNLSLD